MTDAADLVARCRAMSIDLTAEPDGGLTWEAVADPPSELLADLSACKAEVLALLRVAEARAPVPPWDQAEGERLLAELRSEVERIAAGFRGPLPRPLAVLLDDALVIGERYIRDHDMEAARGWDALALLRDLVSHVRDLVTRWRQTGAMT
jgi:hypothetical protein